MLRNITRILTFVSLAALAAATYSISLAQHGPHQPDLVVRVSGPPVAAPGQDISNLIALRAGNRGIAAAPGTTGALDPANGYMIDLVLSSDAQLPEGFAIYSHNWAEDVLVRGGRVSRTTDLAPGANRPYPVGAVIPADTPAGRYFLCARIDSGNKVAESSENNNTSCTPIVIRPTR